MEVGRIAGLLICQMMRESGEATTKLRAHLRFFHYGVIRFVQQPTVWQQNGRSIFCAEARLRQKANVAGPVEPSTLRAAEGVGCKCG